MQSIITRIHIAIIVTLAWVVPAQAAEVIKVNKKKKLVTLLLNETEQDMFRVGDQLDARDSYQHTRMKGIVQTTTGFEITVMINPKYLNLRKGEKLRLIPKYRNEHAKEGPGWRNSDGYNLFKERFFVLADAGTGITTDVMAFGARFGMFLTDDWSVAAAYSMGSYADSYVTVEGTMMSLRFAKFWGYNFHTHAGLTMRDTLVLPIVETDEKGQLIPIDESMAEAQKDPEYPNYENYVTDYMLDLGLSNQFSIPSVAIGHVFLLGIDWITVELRLASKKKPNPLNSYLEWAFPTKNATSYYSRIFFGLSF